jgi:hypothetical protein
MVDISGLRIYFAEVEGLGFGVQGSDFRFEN